MGLADAFSQHERAEGAEHSAQSGETDNLINTVG